jgi:hypothetical protein
MKPQNIYLILVAIILVTTVVCSLDEQKEDFSYENPVSLACW